MMERLSTIDLLCALTDSTSHWETMAMYLDVFLPVEFTHVEEKGGLVFICGNQLQKKIERNTIVVKKTAYAMETSELLNAKFMGEELWINEAMKEQAMAVFTRALPVFKFTTNKEKEVENEMERALAISMRFEAMTYYAKYVLIQTFLRSMGSRVEDLNGIAMRENLLFLASHPVEKVKVKSKANAVSQAKFEL